MTKNRRFTATLLAVLVCLLSLAAVLVMAQAVEPPPVADPDVAFDMLIKTISAITVGFAASPFAVTVVSLLKRIPALRDVRAPTLTFIVGVALWVLSAVFGALGYTVQFNSALEAATTILPSLAGLFAVLISAPKLHQASAEADVRFFGYSRTPPAT